MQQQNKLRRWALALGAFVTIGVVTALALQFGGKRRSPTGIQKPQSQETPTEWTAHAMDDIVSSIIKAATGDKAGNEYGEEDQSDETDDTPAGDPPPPPFPSGVIESNETSTTLGAAAFAPFLESRLGNMLPGCTPSTGKELREVVESSTCTVVTLMPGVTYLLSDFIRVSRRISIIGRPLDMPTIDAHLAYRAFTVEPGGLLDLRFVRIFRGKPIRVARSLYEIRGGALYIRRGGRAVITSCLLTVNPILITEFLISQSQATVRLLGGYILQEEGTLVITDVRIYVTRPGVLFREIYTVGGQVLVLGGNLVATGCTFLGNFLFINVFGVGDALAVFGGTAIFTGCSFTLNVAFIASQGTGLLLFMGGGVTVFTGCQSIINIGARSFFGAGGAIWNGAGVTIMTGMSIHANLALLFGAGVGFVLGQGAGIFIKTGVSQTGYVAINAEACLGFALFVGSGIVVQSETVWARVAAITAYYGGGGSVYIHAGAVSFINTFGLIINAIAFIAASGGHLFLHAGWFTSVNVYFYKFEAITALYGQGTEILILAGGAAMINTGYQGGTYFLFHGNRQLAQIWIAGHDVVLKSNKTFSGALASRDGVTYIPKRNKTMRVSMKNVAFKKYNEMEVERVFGLKTHHRHLASLRSNVDKLLVQGAQQRFLEESKAVSTPLVLATSATIATQMGADVEANIAAVEDGMLRMPVLGEVYIPPIPQDVRTDNVYLAGALDECSLCDIHPGRTFDNVDGPGAAACAIADSCDSVLGADGSLFPGSTKAEQMWNPPAGNDQANSSIAVIELQAWYTPTSPSASRIDPASVAIAVEQASMALGLPQRYHLKVQPDTVNPLAFHNDEYVIAAQTDSKENGGLNAGEYGTTLVDEEAELLEALLKEGERKMMYEECTLGKTFKFYLVSDWRNVTDAHMKAFKRQEGAKALGLALQDAQPVDERVQICEARVKTAVPLFVPGRKVSLFKDYAANDGKTSSLFALGQQDMLPLAVAELTDVATGNRVDDVQIGETYTLDLQHFPPSLPVTVKLVPRNGLAVMILGIFSSQPTNDVAQAWNWTVSKAVAPGAYYLEVVGKKAGVFDGPLGGLTALMATTDISAFAYTQAFVVFE